MKVLFWIQTAAIIILIISVIALGAEIFINDTDNTSAITVWGIIAIAALNINAFAAIYRFWRSGNAKEKTIAIFLFFLIIIFWIAKAVRIKI